MLQRFVSVKLLGLFFPHNYWELFRNVWENPIFFFQKAAFIFSEVTRSMRHTLSEWTYVPKVNGVRMLASAFTGTFCFDYCFKCNSFSFANGSHQLLFTIPS